MRSLSRSLSLGLLRRRAASPSPSSSSLSRCYYYSTNKPSTDAATAAEWPRPSEIPFQAKVANAVTLIGHVHMPVQSQEAPDGKFWAGTVIARDESPGSPPLWVPVLFEGDLAHVAALHLKENDHVCIGGQLSADPPPMSVDNFEANVQVMVRSINFVEGSSKSKKGFVSGSHEKSSALSAVMGKQNEGPWRNLINNPTEWWDHRENKLGGLVHPKFPDFKRKDGALALWLNTAPKGILLEIEGLKFDTPSRKAKLSKEQKGDDAWKSLVEEPDKWWDNRSNKPKETYPDFKHKETKQALWLRDSPSWVLSKLPPIKVDKFAARKNGYGMFS